MTHRRIKNGQLRAWGTAERWWAREVQGEKKWEGPLGFLCKVQVEKNKRGARAPHSNSVLLKAVPSVKRSRHDATS